MSADARRRISEAQKARWAKQKGANGAAADTAGSVATEQSPRKATSKKTPRKSSRKKR